MTNIKIIVIVLAVGLLLSIGCVTSQKQIRPDIGKSKLNDPKAIDPTTVFVEVPMVGRNASAGNSEGLDLEVRVRDNRRERDLDELKEANFEIKTVAMPPGAPEGYNLQIKHKSFRIVYIDCIEDDCIPETVIYGMSIIPELPSGTNETWSQGDHTIRVKYLMGAYEDLSGTVFFRIDGNSS